VQSIRCSVVCLSVCVFLSVGHNSEPYKNGLTDRDAVWVVDSGGPKGLRVRWEPRSRQWKGQFEGCSPLSPPSKMNCNSESAENGHVNCIMSIPADSVWSQQYTGVVRLQVHICIYVKKQFE